MRRSIIRSVAAAGAALLLAVAPARAGEPAVLVELFTSQGCNACPPADRALAALTEAPDVVALSLHVDYWDYLGWRDSFARPLFTRRQYAYRDRFGARMVYTPQMVVQGRARLVGSRREELAASIAAARAEGRASVLSIEATEDGLTAVIAAGGARGVIWLATYERAASVDIERGENRGKRLTYHNVVRELARLGWADGSGGRFAVPRPEPGQGVAVWIQGEGLGPVTAAAKFER
ncbi:MAG: DUF1223 domain-containing protein [Paracoccaceae bacterium]